MHSNFYTAKKLRKEAHNATTVSMITVQIILLIPSSVTLMVNAFELEKEFSPLEH